MNKEAVYIISSTSGHFKIGRSTNPKRRLKELRKTAGPYEFTLEHYWWCGENEAQVVEEQLHCAFDGKRVNGEWFVLYPSDFICLGEIMADRWFWLGHERTVSD